MKDARRKPYCRGVGDLHHRHAQRTRMVQESWWTARAQRGRGVVLFGSNNNERNVQFAGQVLTELFELVPAVILCEDDDEALLKGAICGGMPWRIVYVGVFNADVIQKGIEGQQDNVYVISVGILDRVIPGTKRTSIVNIQRSAQDCALSILKTICVLN